LINEGTGQNDKDVYLAGQVVQIFSSLLPV